MEEKEKVKVTVELNDRYWWDVANIPVRFRIMIEELLKNGEMKEPPADLKSIKDGLVLWQEKLTGGYNASFEGVKYLYWAGRNLKSVFYLDFLTIQNAIRREINEDGETEWDVALDAEVLLVDNIFVDRETGGRVNYLEELVIRRFNNAKPTILVVYGERSEGKLQRILGGVFNIVLKNFKWRKITPR